MLCIDNMPDPFAESAALLEDLVQKVMKESDPVKYDQLAAEIRRALDARECLKAVLQTEWHDPDDDLLL